MRVLRSSIGVTALLTAICLHGTAAQATCTGGTKFKGSFGVIIHGPAGGGSLMLGGSMKSDGNCGLSGTLSGGLTGLPANTFAVSGTYSVPTNGQGTMSLSLAGLTFGFGVVKGGKQLTGVETDGAAITTIDLTVISAGTYSNASISGTYIQTCYGGFRAGNGPDTPTNEVDYETYDGAGRFSGITINNSGSNHGVSTYTGTYTVNPDGTYTSQDDPPFQSFSLTGAIVNAKAELHSVVTTTPLPGKVGPIETCIEKKR